MKNLNDNVFFITSNQSKLETKISYCIEKKKCFINLKKILTIQQKYQKEDFTVYVYSFDVVRNEIKEIEKDPKTKAYKAVIYLNYNKYSFEGEVFFKEKKKCFNSFFYDLEFQKIPGFFGATYPPPNIKFSKAEQMRIFNNALKALKIKQGEPLSITLITDSLCYIVKHRFYLDFYLEVLKACYTKIEVKLILMMFNLENVILPKELNKKYYLSILSVIEKNPDLIIKHCSEQDNKDKYYKSFYTLLLFFRYNYEKDKINKLINNKEIWKYLVDILSNYSKFFPNLHISDELLNELLKQKELSFKELKNILSYGGSVEKILNTINNNCDLIANCCIKEKEKINIIELAKPNPADDLNIIINYIDKLLNYQLNSNKIFILIQEDFWENYIKYNIDQINLKNLVLIKKTVILYHKIDKIFSLGKLNLNEKIHMTGLQAIEKGILKNEELINFIEKDDDYYKEKTFELTINGPKLIIKGIDLETMNDKFFEIWSNSNICQIVFSEYNFKKELVNKVNNMKYFGNLLKFFNSKDIDCDEKTGKLLIEKFINIVKTYKKETCPNFIKDVSLFIYIMDKIFKDSSHLMSYCIEKYIPSVEIIIDIYYDLACNYKDISDDAIYGIIDFCFKNKHKFKSVLFVLIILKKIKSVNVLKIIFNEINTFVIKEEELFSQEKNIDSFKLLEEIEKVGLLKKYQELLDTNYIISTVIVSSKLFDNIKKGEIKVRYFYQIWEEKEKRKLLKQRLNILFLNNSKDADDCIRFLESKFKDLMKINTFLMKLNEVLKEFYENKHRNNISIINSLEKQINEGMINEIENPDIKNKIEQIRQIIPDLDKKYNLKCSIFFTHFLKSQKAKKTVIKNEDEIFIETEYSFNQLKLLFEENWIYKIDEPLINDCYNALKDKSDNNIYSELKLLRDYFDLKAIDDLYLQKLQEDIIIFKKKEDISQMINSFIHFILEFKVKQTDFYKILVELKYNLSKNISVEKIKHYSKILEKYGINILNPKEENKDYLFILNALYQEKYLLNFILTITDEDFLKLEKKISGSKNTFLNKNDIQDIKKFSIFIQGMDFKKDITTDQELLKIFNDKIRQNKHILVYFNQYITNSKEINKLLKKEENEEEDDSIEEEEEEQEREI